MTADADLVADFPLVAKPATSLGLLLLGWGRAEAEAQLTIAPVPVASW